MMEISFYTLTVIIFAAVFAFIVYLDRKNFSRQGIVFLRRTSKGKIIINNLAKNFPRFWRFYGNLGMVIFIPAMLITVGLFSQTLYTVLTAPQTRGVGLLLPSVTSEVKLLPGIVAIPFWFWLLGIIIIAVVHEFAHGIIAIREGIPVKSLGGVLFGPILGAFVEIDEKKMVKADWKITARIASAGALTNMVFSLIFIILFVGATVALYEPHGMAFAVDPKGPFNQTGMQIGIMKSIDNTQINTYKDLGAFLQNTHPGQTVEVKYQDTNFTNHDVNITLANRPDNKSYGYMGVLTNNQNLFGIVDGSQYRTAYAWPAATEFFVQFLGWVAMLNLLVGLFNLLPVKPLDGGLIWEAYARRFTPKKKEVVVKITNYIIYGMFLLLLAGIIRSIFM